MSRAAKVCVVLACGSVLVGSLGCGDTAERQARASACAAREDIAATIVRLRATPPAQVRNAWVDREIQAIRADVARIRELGPALAGEQRRLVRDGTATFHALMAQIGLDRPGVGHWEANPVGNMQSLDNTLDGMVHKTLSRLDCG